MSYSVCSVVIVTKEPLALENAYKDLFTDTYEHVYRIAESIGTKVFVLYQGGECPSMSFNDAKSLLDCLIKIGDEYENMIIFHHHAPFVDLALSQEIKKAHLNKLADYTFYEHYPQGLAPFALYKGALETLKESGELTGDYHPLMIEDALKNQLNSYDIEVLLAPNDFRFLKESFFLNDQRTIFLTRQLKPVWKEASLLEETLKTHGHLFVATPSFIEISLTNQRKSHPVFLLEHNNPLEELSFDLLKDLINCINELNPQATIQFTLLEGEPCLYSHFQELLSFIKEQKNIQFILETEGAHLEPYLQMILSLENLKVIFYIGASREDLYTQVHGTDDFQTVENTISYLINKKPKDTYLQFPRMTCNEEDIKDFFDRWNSFSNQILISQYNSLAQKLKDQKVIDLTPLHRFPCFKLQRELFINAYGHITFCAQDYTDDTQKSIKYQNKNSLLESLLLKGKYYHKQVQLEFEEICKKCDIWYLFNK